MINKKILAVALLLSQQSFAGSFYVQGGYKGEFFNHDGSVKITGLKDSAESKSLTVDSNTEKGIAFSQYNANHNSPFAASVAVGYKGLFPGSKTELELTYSRVKANNVGLADGPISVHYKDKLSNANSPTNSPTYKIDLNNDQVTNISGMVNTYYQWDNDRFSFSPYVGAGVGLTRIEMYEKASIGLAYQLKAGVNYRMTEDTDIYVGYRHFGVMNGASGEFDVYQKSQNTVNSQDKKQHEIKQTSDKLKVENSYFGTHGIEVGMTVHFATKS